MPDDSRQFDRAYNEALAEARRQFRGGVAQPMLRQFYRDFARLLGRLSELGGTEALTSARAEALRREIEQVMAAYARRFGTVLGDGAARAAEIAIGGHRAATAAASEAAGVSVAFQFDGAPTRALENMFARRGLEIVGARSSGGLSGTFETLARRRIRPLSGAVDDLLTEGVARGQSAGSLTRDLADLMARDDPALRSVLQGSSISTSQLHAGKYPRGASKELRRLLYDARRISVTEVNTALHEATIRGMQNSSVVSLTRWTRSGRHAGLRSAPCVCDWYAEEDVYGLGAGVFHPDNVPSRPHPHCQCVLQAVLRRPSEWNEPPPQKPALRQGDEQSMQRVLEANANQQSRSVTPAYVRSQLRMGNRNLRYADEAASAAQT